MIGVGHLEDVVQVVRDEHDREALLAQAPHEVEHLPRLRDAQRRRRLVEDHELRVPHDGLGHRDRLALPTGQAGHRLAHGADRGDRKGRQGLLRAALHAHLVETPQGAELLAAEEHVLHDVEVVGQREVLVDDLDPELGGVLRAVDGDLVALEQHVPRVDRVDARDALDERRLACAVVADERHDLARADVEVDLVERLHGAEGLRDAAQLEHWCAGHWCVGHCLSSSCPVRHPPAAKVRRADAATFARSRPPCRRPRTHRCRCPPS